MVQLGLPAARLLQSLPQRPPTPPKESDNKTVQVDPAILQRIFSESLGAHTPPHNSPVSSAESANPSDKSHKKVGWSAWTEYKDPPKPLRKGSPPQHHLRPLPPSGELKPPRSILKPYNGVIAVDQRPSINKFAAPYTYPNFATMLESIVKQLAGEDRSSRLDAYMTLAGVLKASDNIPDSKALKDKMGLLMQFMQRDISAKTASGIFDTVVINNALVLLAIFVWKPAVADCLSVEFSTFVVDHSIAAFQDTEVPKDIVKHLLFIIGHQNFSAKIMTSDRVRRLIEALSGVESHVKGRSIVLGRLTIYRKLLKQAKVAMLASINWVENLFTDMMSSIKEIRIPAVAFGIEAALLLGSEKQVSRAVMDLFQGECHEMKYAEYYARRLSSMLSNKQDGAIVPQIWSVVILFLRCRPHQLEHWEFMNIWLQVIEKCFNSSDHDIKTQANFAWNRLVFAIRLDEHTTPTMIKMLGQPLGLQLKRKLVSRHAKEAKQITIGSVCNLLYYAMRPNATFAQLDLYWDEYVVQLIRKMLVSRDEEISDVGQEDLAQACALMRALLDISPKAWVNSRANENSIVKAEELPGIDPKWVRKNAQRVFDVLAPMVEKCFRNLAKWESQIFVVWSRFVSSVASAGAKEVKVSNDTMSSVACIFNLLYKLWENGPRNLLVVDDADYTHFQEGFSLLVTTTIKSLGVLPFTEKLLSMGPQEGFAIVATPSRSASRVNGEVKSPLHHLFALMAHPAAEIKCDEVYVETVKAVLYAFLEARKIRRSRIEFVKELSQLLPSSISESRALTALWRALARLAIIALDPNTASSSSISSGSHGQPLGAEYRNVVKILEIGISVSLDTPLPDWKDLFAAITAQIVVDAGESGHAISVIEPLARALQEKSLSAEQRPSLAYCQILLSSAAYPREKQSLDAARRCLWGTSTASTKSPSFDPYLHLYTYIRQCLEESYSLLSSDGSEEHVQLLLTLADLIQRCPAAHTTNVLVNIQEGVAPWILDKNLKFGSCTPSAIADSVTTLWTKISAAISRLPITDSILLRSLEPLLCSALGSKHKATLIAAVNLWNSTFGSETTLDYPSRIAEVLLRLRLIADLQLPSFPEDLEDEVLSPGPTFLNDSQESIQYLPTNFNSSKSSRNQEPSPYLKPPSLPRLGREASPRVLVEVPLSESRKRPSEETPEPRKRKAAKKNLTPKLRHDDSQIQFAAINSSPLADAVLDSQLLTDRQREVKERQTETGALFANLGSSPNIKINSGLSILSLDSNRSTVNQTDAEIPTTPIILPRDRALFDDYITSSPTPSRETAGVRLESDVIEPPSSPPVQSSQKGNPNLTVSAAPSHQKAEEPMSDIWDVTSSPVRRHDVSRASIDLGQSAQFIEDFVDASGQNLSIIENLMEDDPALPPSERPSTPLGTRGATVLEQQAARTPNEIFVDALSSPAPPTPAKETKSDNVYADALSSPLGRSVLQQANAMPDYPRVSVSNPSNHPSRDDQQYDLSISSSLSGMDGESMLRLITKFDGADPQHVLTDKTAAEVTTKAAPLPGRRDASNGAIADQHSKMATACENELDRPSIRSSESPRLSGHVAPSKESEAADSKSVNPLETGHRIIKSLLASRLKDNTVTPSTIPETPVKDSLTVTLGISSARLRSIDGAGNTDSLNKFSSKQTRTSTRSEDMEGCDVTKKRKINDEGTEIPNSQGGGTTGYTGQIKKIKTSCHLLPPLDDGNAQVSTFAGANNQSSTDLDTQAEASADITSDRDVYMSDSNSNGRNKPSSTMLGHIQGEEKNASQSSSEPYEGWDTSIEVRMASTNVPSARVGEGSQRSDLEEYKMTGPRVIERFEEILKALRLVALTRQQAMKVEDLLWDVKGELYAAEKRGREER